MRITKDILNEGEWELEDIFKFNGNRYKKMICKRCGAECLSPLYLKRVEAFCTRGCAAGFNKNRTCPYASKGIPKYDLYVDRLEPYEQCKRSEQDPNILLVRCRYCGKWFVPSASQVYNRIGGIRHNDTRHFYCSTECKKECPSYNQTLHYKGYIGMHSREVQPELRKLVFLRDKYECQKCGSGGYLHCHHIEGVEQNPIESADIDMCITLCKKCHELVHTKDGCRRRDLHKCPEENQTMVVTI